METRLIAIKEIQQNKGQIHGLPSNPRVWAKAQLDALARSITATPELVEARGIIVLPYNGKYVAIGGNMRLAAAKEAGWESVTCIVLPEDTDVTTLKRIIAKDNSQFGEWDFAKLQEQWDDVDMTDWGVTDTWSATAAISESKQIQSEKKQCPPQSNRVIITYPKAMAEILQEILGVEELPQIIHVSQL